MFSLIILAATGVLGLLFAVMWICAIPPRRSR